MPIEPVIFDISSEETVSTFFTASFTAATIRSSRVSISSGVTVLSGGLFSKCRNLTDIIIPHSVEAIHGNAFEMCDSLERIFIPKSVTCIRETAFDQRKRKKKLTIQAPKDSYAIEYAKKI